MNRFKRIAALAIGLGSGIAAGYLSKPERRNKLRNAIRGEISLENNETKSNKKRPAKLRRRSKSTFLRKNRMAELTTS